MQDALTPWSIRVADVSSGKGREVWHAEKGPGSVYHAMVASDQLYWADGDRLAFACRSRAAVAAPVFGFGGGRPGNAVDSGEF